MTRIRAVVAAFPPTDPEFAAALARRWAELPETARTPGQLLGRHAVGCEGTHGVFPKCNLACTPCYHSRDANQVRVDGPHTLARVRAQMALLREQRGPRAHAQLIGARLRGQSVLSVLALGAVSGLAGFCAGPILGAVLTVAATSGAAASGALLLGAFALGMTLPVAILALVWDRWHVADRRALRRTIWIGRSEVPIVRAVAGVLFVTLGVSFVVFRGSSALSGAYAAAGLADLLQRLETLLR